MCGADECTEAVKVMQEKLKRKMMEKFRDGEVARLHKIVNSGKVIGAELLINEMVEKLRAKVALCEAQRDGHKVSLPASSLLSVRTVACKYGPGQQPDSSVHHAAVGQSPTRVVAKLHANMHSVPPASQHDVGSHACLYLNLMSVVFQSDPAIAAEPNGGCKEKCRRLHAQSVGGVNFDWQDCLPLHAATGDSQVVCSAASHCAMIDSVRETVVKSKLIHGALDLLPQHHHFLVVRCTQ